MNVKLFTKCRDQVVANCSQVIVGKDDVISLVLTCFLCSAAKFLTNHFKIFSLEHKKRRKKRNGFLSF